MAAIAIESLEFIAHPLSLFELPASPAPALQRTARRLRAPQVYPPAASGLFIMPIIIILTLSRRQPMPAIAHKRSDWLGSTNDRITRGPQEDDSPRDLPRHH